MNTTYYLWLNDTSPQRYYWNQILQDWVADFKDATLFSTWDEASDEAVVAGRTTKSEVVVGVAQVESDYGD